MSHRDALILEISRKFVPLLVLDGFVQVPLTVAEQKSSELKLAFPFGRYKRRHGDDIQIIEIQFDKRGAAKFVVNVGVVPPEGAKLPWVQMLQEEAEVAALQKAVRLYRKARVFSWFRLSWIPSSLAERSSRVVDELISKYPEIDTWLAVGTIGPSMRNFGFAETLSK